MAKTLDDLVNDYKVKNKHPGENFVNDGKNWGQVVDQATDNAELRKELRKPAVRRVLLLRSDTLLELFEALGDLDVKGFGPTTRAKVARRLNASRLLSLPDDDAFLTSPRSRNAADRLRLVRDGVVLPREAMPRNWVLLDGWQVEEFLTMYESKITKKMALS